MLEINKNQNQNSQMQDIQSLLQMRQQNVMMGG